MKTLIFFKLRSSWEYNVPFKYYFGGIEITSQIPFKRLRTARPGDQIFGQTEIIAVQGPAPAEDERLFDWPGRFGMKLGKSGDQWRVIASNGVILIEPDAAVVRIFAPDPNETLLKDLLVRRLLPRLVKLKGAVTYHAASLEKDGLGILLMGESGAGKSTMSAGLRLAGDWTIHGDDMALIWQDGGDVITSAGADIAIWPQSAEGLCLPDPSRKTLLGYDGKQSFQPDVETMDGPRKTPVSGIFFLHRTGECDRASVSRLSRPEAFARALKQVVLFNPNGVASAERISSTTRLNETLKIVPAWQLTYPSRFSAFSDVSRTLLSALQA